MTILGQIDPNCDRAAKWREVYGSTCIPLTSKLPYPAFYRGGVGMFYRVNIEQITPDQLERAICYIAKEFDLSAADVRKGILHQEGIPIKAADVKVMEVTAQA